MRRLLPLLTALALAPSAHAATAHFRAHVELVSKGVTVLVDGEGDADGSRRISTFAFHMLSGGGDAVLLGRTPFVAYVRGPKTGAPAGKPWGRFSGAASVPFFDPAVALRLHAGKASAHVRMRVPAAEVPRLFPAAAHAAVTADVWTDAAGRVVRLTATATRAAAPGGTITIDEHLSGYGTPVRATEPAPSTVYLRVP